VGSIVAFELGRSHCAEQVIWHDHRRRPALDWIHALETGTGSYTSNNGTLHIGRHAFFSTDRLTLNALENFPIGDISQDAHFEIRRSQGIWVDVDKVSVGSYSGSKSREIRPSVSSYRTVKFKPIWLLFVLKRVCLGLNRPLRNLQFLSRSICQDSGSLL
jgi:hypothetical protein